MTTAATRKATTVERETFRIQMDGRGNWPVELRGDGRALLFDELAIGQWFHLERMNANDWFLSVGSRAIWITVNRKGEARITGEDER